jgi:uncharacterized protein YpmB
VYVHPKTGELLWNEVEEIVAIVKEVGYPTVYGVAHEHTVYYVRAYDKQGRTFFLYLDPETGTLLEDP